MKESLEDFGEARLAMRLVIWLSKFSRGEPEVPPIEALTQAGLGAALSASQGAISRILTRLAAAEVLVGERRRVRGRLRAVKIYRLTWKGEELVRELSRAADQPKSAVAPTSVSTEP